MTKKSQRSHIPKSHLPGLMILVFTLLMFYWSFSFLILNPIYIDWIMITASDRVSYYLAWSHFRYEDWHWPPGIIQNYNYPMGNSVGLNDAIPLLAIPLKLFHPLLPKIFQYFGWWLFICYFLQGFISARLLRSCGVKDPLLRGLGGMVFMITPFLVARLEHMALNAHWVLLAGLLFYSYSYYERYSLKRIITSVLLVLAIAAAIHPYLCIQYFALAQVVFFHEWLQNKRLKIGQFFACQIVAGTVTLLVWYVMGYFVIPAGAMDVGGFGHFSSNLNTFFNPMNASRIIPELPILPEQSEGMGFIGITSWILLVLALFRLISQRDKLKIKIRQHAFLLSAAFLFFIYALSNKIVFNQFVLLEIPLPYLIDKATSIFRASGRFIWFPAYLLILLGVLNWLRLDWSQWLKRLLLLALVLLQFWDIQPQFDHLYLRNGPFPQPFDPQRIIPLFESADLVLTYPPFEKQNILSSDYHHWAYLAALAETPITTGYPGRIDWYGQYQFKEKLEAQLKMNDLGKYTNTAIVLRDTFLKDFDVWEESGLFDREVFDGYSILITKSK